MNISADALGAVKPKVEEYLGQAGYVLVDMRSYRAQGGSLVIEFLVDRGEGGILIDEVARLSRELAGVLDVSGLFEFAYALEVSSPGLDRPLVTPHDFKRAIGRSLMFFLKEPVAGKIEHMGSLLAVTGTGVTVRTKETTLDIPFTHVNKAKQVIL